LKNDVHVIAYNRTVLSDYLDYKNPQANTVGLSNLLVTIFAELPRQDIKHRNYTII